MTNYHFHQIVQQRGGGLGWGSFRVNPQHTFTDQTLAFKKTTHCGHQHSNDAMMLQWLHISTFAMVFSKCRTIYVVWLCYLKEGGRNILRYFALWWCSIGSHSMKEYKQGCTFVPSLLGVYRFVESSSLKMNSLWRVQRSLLPGSRRLIKMQFWNWRLGFVVCSGK